MSRNSQENNWNDANGQPAAARVIVTLRSAKVARPITSFSALGRLFRSPTPSLGSGARRFVWGAKSDASFAERRATLNAKRWAGARVTRWSHPTEKQNN